MSDMKAVLAEQTLRILAVNALKADGHSEQQATEMVRRYFKALRPTFVQPEAGFAWIAVGDRMPEPNDWVLVHNGEWTGVGKYAVAEHLEPSERWQSETSEFIEHLGPKVTHWAPLPPAPQQSSE